MFLNLDIKRQTKDTILNFWATVSIKIVTQYKFSIKKVAIQSCSILHQMLEVSNLKIKFISEIMLIMNASN